MKTYLQEFLDQFIALGGVVENIFVREGENGRAARVILQRVQK